MNELRQALQTAFEALRLAEALLDPINHNSHCECDPSVGYQCVVCRKPDPELVQIRAALAAAEAALAKPGPEPVAELASVTAERDLLRAELRRLHGEFSRTERRNIELSDEVSRRIAELETLHGLLDCDSQAGESVAQLAAQRQPLTDEQIWIAVECGRVGGIGLPSKAIAVARAIERAHGISAAATTPSAPRAPADQQ